MPGWSIGLSEHERLTFTLLSPPEGEEGYEWLTFGFGLDQTFLKKTISELDRAIGESKG